jgi:hypothetical protein
MSSQLFQLVLSTFGMGGEHVLAVSCQLHRQELDHHHHGHPSVKVERGLSSSINAGTTLPISSILFTKGHTSVSYLGFILFHAINSRNGGPGINRLVRIVLTLYRSSGGRLRIKKIIGVISQSDWAAGQRPERCKATSCGSPNRLVKSVFSFSLVILVTKLVD